MIVGCYTLDLYCDHPKHKDNVEISKRGAHQYTGITGGECRQAARRDGWKIRNNVAICPICANKDTTP